MEGNIQMKSEVFFLKYAFPCSFIILQRGEITQEEFDQLEKAAINEDILPRKKLEKIFKTKTQKEWIHIFKQEPNCCCTPVLDLKGAISFLRWMGRKELFTLKDAKGRAIPQWLFPFGNPLLSRKKQSFPPRLV